MSWGKYWRAAEEGRPSHRFWLPLSFTVLLLVITVVLWHSMKSQERVAVVEAVAQQLAWGKEAIIARADQHLMASQRMVHHWQWYEDRGEWDDDARHYLQQYPGVVAVGWVDAAHHTRYLVSKPDGMRPEYFDLLLRKHLSDVVAAAQKTRTSRFSGIIHARPGENNAFLVTPIFVGGQFSGFIITLFDASRAFDSALGSTVKDGWIFQVSVGADSLQTPAAAIAPESERWSQTTPMQVPGLSMALMVAPGPEVLARICGDLSTVVLIAGLVLTGLFTWGAWAARMVKIKSDKLSEATRLLRQLREAMDSSAIISLTDVRGTITYANENFCKISGYPREELLGKNHRIIKSGFHPREYYTEMWRTIARGQVWKGEFCNRAKDGSSYWVYATVFPILGATGRPEAYMGIPTSRAGSGWRPFSRRRLRSYSAPTRRWSSSTTWWRMNSRRR